MRNNHIKKIVRKILLYSFLKHFTKHDGYKNFLGDPTFSCPVLKMLDNGYIR